jgi:low temperature requirement protein LtrA
MALIGYWYTHIAMIFGIVLIAAGVRQVVEQDAGLLPQAGWLLATGTGLYLAGDSWFRQVMRIRPVIARAVGSLVALSLGGLGLLWGNIAELCTLIVLLVGILACEPLLEHIRGGVAEEHADPASR